MLASLRTILLLASSSSRGLFNRVFFCGAKSHICPLTPTLCMPVQFDTPEYLFTVPKEQDTTGDSTYVVLRMVRNSLVYALASYYS